MDQATKMRWLDLCTEVAICDDAKRLEGLAMAIVAVLRQEELQLRAQGKAQPAS